MIDFYTTSKNIKDDSVYKIKHHTVNIAYNGTARDWIFSLAGKFRLLQVLKLQTLGTEKCSAKDSTTVYPGSFKTGFSVFKYIPSYYLIILLQM
jgi:hypothetical protein